MKTKTVNTEKKDIPRFAFLPNMVLDHLNEATPTQPIEENPNKPIAEKITIKAESQIPDLDSTIEIIPKKEKAKPLETVDEPVLEASNSETEENFIIRFLKKIRSQI